MRKQIDKIFDVNDSIIQAEVKRVIYDTHSPYDSLIGILSILFLVGLAATMIFVFYKGIKLLLSKNTPSL